MRFVHAKEGDVRDISVCRRKALEKVNSKMYSEAAVKELIEVHSEDIVRQDLEDYDVFCLKKRGLVVGTVYIDGNVIEGLHVHPLFIGRAYGRKMLRLAENRIRKCGYSFSGVFSDLPSEGFYRGRSYISLGATLSLTKNCMKFVYMAKKLK